MPTRVLLEGPAIEPLLAQVREEYGSGVRIISADKVRSGGIGGFFAKQHYELSVEVPDIKEERNPMPQRKAPTATMPPPPPPVSPPVQEEPADSLEQLLARAESKERGPRPSPKPAPAEKQAGREAAMADIEEAIEQRDLSENATAFAELMAGLDAANHIATAHRPAQRPKDKEDTPTVRPFRPATATGAPINSGGLKPLAPVPSLAELMGGLGVSEEEMPAFQPAKPPPMPSRSAAAAYGLSRTVPEDELPPSAVPTSPAAPAASVAGLAPSSPAGLASPAGVAPGSPAAPPPPLAPMLRSVLNDPVITNLMSVGMPEAMAAQITGGDTYAGVLTALAARPAAPGIPDGPGEILVLAGDLNHAVPIGKELLDHAGIDQSHLLLAGASAAGTGLHSSRVIATPKAAGSRAEKLQQATSGWVIVLDAPVGRTDPIWVSDMCDAIGATAVWAVVDATRKTADTARHLRTLGEVEALVVHSVDLTADPATVLGLELPIFSLDGKPATPHAWAAMLCARIAAEVMPSAATPRRATRAARR